ncbi:MAG TPA: methionine--tRNA ligase [Candidatus Acidoferrales bacterium]|jgi:methionyl-tRNA synthetase|nr:methionine--tRNA ligase [Candidatus Acidoferrales bacterium]
MPKFYITTPIYYVNARPHLGHTYTTVVADTIARYKRMRGFDVVLLTGTDEHGQKVDRAAKAAGMPPLAYADRISKEYRDLWKELELPVDRFVRTTEDRHERAVHRLLQHALDAGYVYQGHYEGQYCVFDEAYVDDPTPGAPCPDCGRPTERVREENYYFKLSAFQDRLLELYEKHPEFIQPETRRNEVIAFVRGGLRDLSISRTSLKWGIPWPGDPKHVFYVWYDALTSYMSGIGYGDDEVQFEKYWPADLHLIGKEILRFHAVYWPAFIMAATVKGEPLELPKQIFAHGWWTFAGEKMSKSKGNIALAQPVARVLGIDALRYFLLREMVFGQDSNFSYESLVTRYNSDLANGLGNLASRVLTMIQNYFGGEIPSAGVAGDRESGVARTASAAIAAALEQYDRYEFSRALETIWAVIAEVDKYLVENQPWKLAGAESQKERLGTILYTAAEALRIVTLLAHPVLPHATRQIWQQLGQVREIAEFKLDDVVWGGLNSGSRIGEPQAVFPRVKKEETIERIETMEDEIRNPAPPATPAAGAPAAAPASHKIGIEDFAKVEMRVGEVKSAERVAGADKLLKLMVDIGDEVRQIVAGIAEVYKPEDLVGRRVVVVVNLQPRKLRGVESNGMIVAASVPPDGKPVLAGFLEDVPVGSRLK